MAPSSRAVATFIPLLMADWVWFNWPWVADKYCSATSAPLLVLTLKDMWSHLFWLPDFGPGAFWPTEGEASRVPRRRSEKFKHRFFAPAKNQDAQVSAQTGRAGKYLPMTRQIFPFGASKAFILQKIAAFKETIRKSRARRVSTALNMARPAQAKKWPA